MDKVIVDSQYADLKLVDGKLQLVVEVDLIAELKKLAAKSDNKIDDALVELVEKALV